MLAWIGGSFVVFLSFMSTIMIILGFGFTIWGFKYRKDANIDLRKTTHENIVRNYYFFLEGLKDKNKMLESGADVKLLTLFSSPLTRRRYRDSIKNLSKIGIDYKILLSQFRDYQNIKDDFFLSKNHSFNKFALKYKLIDKKITDQKELVNILTLICIAFFTESLPLVKVDDFKITSITNFANLIKIIKDKKIRLSKKNSVSDNLDKVNEKLENINLNEDLNVTKDQ